LVARDIDPRLIVEVEKVVLDEVGEPDVADDVAVLGDVTIPDAAGGNALGSDALNSVVILLNDVVVLPNDVAVLLNDVAVLEVDRGNEQTPISS